MHRQNTSAWQLRCDFPEYLQFSGAIAQQEGFRFDDGTPPVSSAEAQWRAWWNSLFVPLPKHFTFLPSRGDPRLRARYDPPTFSLLARWPDVQALCWRYYPFFREHWGTIGGDKEPMAALLDEQLQRVRVDKVVSACAAAAGKRESAPFVLAVDFVVWPADYRRVVGDTYVVLGKRYLDTEQATTLQEILREHIARLV
jgi:hypothetical protein